MTGIPDSSTEVSAATDDPDQQRTMDGVKGVACFALGTLLALLAAALLAA